MNNLSDEEKKAIENVKSFVYSILNGISAYDCKILLNLIEKQSKEIEELRKDKLELINKNHVVHLKDVEKELREMRKEVATKNAEIQCLNVIHESYKEMMAENNYISKDKIKAKIEELENDPNNIEEHNCLRADTCYVIDVLQSLLEKE